MRNLRTRTFVLATLVLLAIVIPFLLFGQTLDAWTARLLTQAAARPLVTGALLALLLASDILLPIPSSLVSTACGMTLGLAGGAAASFLGMSASTAAGYLLGRWAAPAAERLLGSAETGRLRALFARHGAWMLLALRPVPVLAEASVLFSGISRQPPGRAALAASLGNAAVSCVYAAVGAWGRLSDSFLPAFAVSALLSALCLLSVRFRRPMTPTSAS